MSAQFGDSGGCRPAGASRIGHVEISPKAGLAVRPTTRFTRLDRDIVHANERREATRKSGEMASGAG